MRILLITHQFPYPPIAGKSLRNFILVSRIAREYEVWLASFVGTPEEPEGGRQIQKLCQGIITTTAQQIGASGRPIEILHCLLLGRPFGLRFCASPDFAQKIRRFISRVDSNIVQIEGSFIALWLETLPRKTRGKTILTFHDVVYSKFDRINRLDRELARKLSNRLYSHMIRRWEPYYVERFARCVTISGSDRRMLLGANPRLRIDVVPNGVDTHIYQSLPDSASSPLSFSWAT